MHIKVSGLLLAAGLLMATAALGEEPLAEAPAASGAPIFALEPKGLLPETEPVQFRPHTSGTWDWSLTPRRVFGSQSDPILIRKPPSAEGLLQIERNGQPVFQTQVPAGTQQVLVPPLALQSGVQHLRFRWSSSAHSHLSELIPVISLGLNPPDHSYIIVDKEQFSLFWIRYGVLENIYPIATGRPRTPTVPGLWLLGHKEIMSPPTTDWGARRLKIYREAQYQSHWSGYAIHGTNRPTSIGTEASHGCVRMFNHDVIALFNTVPVGTPVEIVEKLPLSEAAYDAIEALLKK